MTDLLDFTLQGFLWVIAIGLTIVIIDVFFETEILSVIALLGIAIYLSLLFDVDLKWRILIALLCWLAVTALFYAVFKRFISPLIRRGFTAGMHESIHSAVGSVGEFRLIDGEAFVYWNGDLWPVDLDGDGAESADSDDGRYEDHDKVTIQTADKGIFTITERSAKPGGATSSH
jgi:membrane protein implicated in regulation of membrane protease activity